MLKTQVVLWFPCDQRSHTRACARGGPGNKARMSHGLNCMFVHSSPATSGLCGMCCVVLCEEGDGEGGWAVE